MKDTDVSGQIQYTLKRINMNVRHVMMRGLYNKELTMHQMIILRIIKENPKVNLTSLGNRLNLAKSSVSLSINKLVDEGYVLRKEDPNDRRNKYVVLSDAGKKALKETREASKQIFSQLLVDLTEEELIEIQNSLLKLETSIEKAINLKL